MTDEWGTSFKIAPKPGVKLTEAIENTMEMNYYRKLKYSNPTISELMELLREEE
jgi:hypothetical protein